MAVSQLGSPAGLWLIAVSSQPCPQGGAWWLRLGQPACLVPQTLLSRVLQVVSGCSSDTEPAKVIRFKGERRSLWNFSVICYRICFFQCESFSSFHTWCERFVLYGYQLIPKPNKGTFYFSSALNDASVTQFKIVWQLVCILRENTYKNLTFW